MMKIDRKCYHHGVLPLGSPMATHKGTPAMGLPASRHPFVLLLIFALFFIPMRNAIAAPRIYLEPATTSVQVGKTVDMAVKIDTSGQETVGADAMISYTTNGDIEIVDIIPGNFFGGFAKGVDENVGRIELHGYFNNLFETKSGNGTIGTIKIKVNKSSGFTALTIPCTGGNNESVILNTDGNNMISCPGSSGATINFVGAPTNTPLPTQTPTPTQRPGDPTHTPRPTSTPTIRPSATRTPTPTIKPTNRPTATPTVIALSPTVPTDPQVVDLSPYTPPVPEGEPTPGIADITEQVDEGQSSWFYVLGGLMTLVLLGTGIYLVRKGHKEKSGGNPPVIKV